ncbi:MAG: phytoene desaturase [Salinivirgaceae bacterium]|nr:MAG: phytoene desaturase [Salinivirgaceae bacterium]
MNKKAIIIGSGIGGISASIHLSKLGYQVDVYEQAEKPGGKLNEIREGGFRFDTGPSLFTLPNLVDNLIELSGSSSKDIFKYDKLENVCRYYFTDGTVFNAWSDTEKFASEASRVFNEPKSNVENYLNRVKEMYDLSADLFIFKPFARFSTLRSKAGKKVATKIHKLDMLLSMHKRNKRSFRSKKLVQLFNRYGTYNGSNPYKAPATLNMIAHLEHNDGAFFPEKGMYSIVTTLVDRAKAMGVKFHFNKKVDRVLVDGKKLIGVEIDHEKIEADKVISDMDVTNFYKHLMPKKKLPLRLKIMEKSSSAIIFYLGINRTFPDLDVHNILFADNYKEEFDYLFKRKRTYHDPTVYIFISNKSTKTDAPSGCENWFVMINAPVNIGQYTEEVLSDVRANVLKKINSMLNVDIESHIVFEEMGNPITIEEKTSSAGGAIYGGSSNSRLSAFLRHPNKHSKIKDLHFVGGSVHPGGGIPLCIASAGIVAEDIKNEIIDQQ